MQVLEMEEVESLVSNASRKRLGNVNGKKISRKESGVAACANLCSNSLPKLVVFACLILIGILYMSAHNDGEGGGNMVELEDIETKAPHTSTSSMPEVKVTPMPTDNIQIAVPSSPPPVENPKTTPPPTIPPTNPPTPPPVNVPENNVETNKVDENNKPDNNDAYLYSKVATILPLIDHPLPNEEEKAALDEKYGRWHFWDGDEDMRPMEDYISKFPNGDIPGEDFPDDVWQADAVFVNHILNDADNLIARAMEAIFVEYGHGKPLEPEGMAERMKMFHWSREDLSVENAQAPAKYGKRGDRGNGGWTTKRSFDGLVRRLLHAMMTQDTFTVVSKYIYICVCNRSVILVTAGLPGALITGLAYLISISSSSFFSSSLSFSRTHI
jgi:hypothetical protein